MAGAAAAEASVPREPPGGIAGHGGFAGVAVGRQQGEGGGPGVRVDEVEVPHGDQAGRGLREAVPPAVLVVEVVVGPDRLLVDDHGEPVQHADRGEHLPGEAPGPVRVQHGERHVVGQQRAEGGIGEHQLVGAGGRAVGVGQGERGQLLPGGRARREQREHRFGQRRGVEPGLGVVDRTLDGGLQRRVLQQGRGIGGGGAEPGEQGVDGVGVGEVQAGNSEPGRQRSLRKQDGGGPSGGAPVDEGDGEGAQVVDQPRHDIGQLAQLGVQRPPPRRRPLDPEQPLDQLRSGDAARAQLGQRGRAVGRGGEVVEACGSEQGRQSWPDAGDVEPLGPARRQLANCSSVTLLPLNLCGVTLLQHRRREPRRPTQSGDDPGSQQAVEGRTGEAGLGHEREPFVRRDRPHEVDVGRGRPVEDGVGDGAEADASAVGLHREGRDQPGGQAEGFGGGGRGVRDVVAERTGERQRPGHRPFPTVALLDGGVGRSEHTAAAHHPPPQRPDRDDPVLFRPPHDVPVDVDLDERGQGEQQVRCGGTGVGEQRGAVDAVAQRQPDLARVPRGRLFGRRPDQPQDRRRIAAAQLGGRAGEFGHRRCRPFRGERHRARRAHDPRRVGDGEHGREPDAEATDRARVVPLGRRAQRRERRHTRRGQRGAGVRHPQLDHGLRPGGAAACRPRAPRPPAACRPRCTGGLPPACRPRDAAGLPDPASRRLRSRGTGHAYCRLRPHRTGGLPGPACRSRGTSGQPGLVLPPRHDSAVVRRDQRDPQPSAVPGGVSSVLGQLDEPRVGVAAEAQVFLGVRVFAEPRGRSRPGVEDRRAQRRGAEGVVHLHPDYSAGSRSTPSS